MHPSRASGTAFEADPGLAQFQVRMPEAILHFPQGGLQIEADCSTDGHWADCGLLCVHPGM
eukprot:12009749-Alexandrium_andersonii.AAC.1